MLHGRHQNRNAWELPFCKFQQFQAGTLRVIEIEQEQAWRFAFDLGVQRAAAMWSHNVEVFAEQHGQLGLFHRYSLINPHYLRFSSHAHILPSDEISSTRMFAEANAQRYEVVLRIRCDNS